MGVVANIKGPVGAVGPAGSEGPQGIAGSTWRNGSGMPSDAVGVDGDYYLDNVSGNVYVKAGGTWA